MSYIKKKIYNICLLKKPAEPHIIFEGNLLQYIVLVIRFLLHMYIQKTEVFL